MRFFARASFFFWMVWITRSRVVRYSSENSEITLETVECLTCTFKNHHFLVPAGQVRLEVSPEVRRDAHPAQEVPEPLDDLLVECLHDDDALGGVVEELGNLRLGVVLELLGNGYEIQC